ncbi:MAG: hypothetical protein ACK554_00350, partial [Erythrobacteraceae bacterium]
MTNIDDTETSDGLSLLARIVLAFGAGIGVLFLAGAIVGYLSVVIEKGDPAARDFAILGALALANGGIAYAAVRLWRRMTPDEIPTKGPGEEAAGPPPSPLLYESASADGAVEGWMLDTIHALPPGTKWRTPEIARVI